MYRIKITIVWVLGYDTFFMTTSSFFSDNTARIVHPFQHSRRSRDFHHLPTAQYLAHGGWPPGKSSSQSNSFINMGPSYHVTCFIVETASLYSALCSKLSLNKLKNYLIICVGCWNFQLSPIHWWINSLFLYTYKNLY